MTRTIQAQRTLHAPMTIITGKKQIPRILRDKLSFQADPKRWHSTSGWDLPFRAHGEEQRGEKHWKQRSPLLKNMSSSPSEGKKNIYDDLQTKWMIQQIWWRPWGSLKFPSPEGLKIDGTPPTPHPLAGRRKGDHGTFTVVRLHFCSPTVKMMPWLDC